jgi:DNA anti-recombination protein RmuC
MDPILVLLIAILIVLIGGIALLWARLKGLSMAYQTLANQYQALVVQQVEGWAKLQQQQEANTRIAHQELKAQISQDMQQLENRLAQQAQQTQQSISQSIDQQANRVIAVIQEPIL